MKYYEACKKMREKRHITLKQVAHSTGYSVQNISAFEHGRINNSIIYNFYLLYIVRESDLRKLVDDAPEGNIFDVPEYLLERFNYATPYDIDGNFYI